MNKEVRMLRYLLWDVDGILVDTEPLKFKAWQTLFTKFGKELSLEEYIPLIGHGGRENMETLLAMKGVRKTYEETRPIYRNAYIELRSRGVPIFEENVRLVREFKEKFPEIVHAVVSSEKKTTIRENLRTAGFDENFFAAVISYEDNPEMKRKPAPDMYLYALEKISAAPTECIAFEDTTSGIAAAADAGLFTVALPNKLTEAQDLLRAQLIILLGAPRKPTDIVAAFRRW
ncbi:hypothetical protein A3A39_02470 [Candidatus Kaiserbacteria bacterium RIFCSPLOWO2_01_FULL_54_13]|uniref:HAD family phosphatase n=1 Tax=Candidatus Kaiserbacteria bacterium RIFCSPLOWO2_01_FULL_54_13 TaxID=1798512 RepID=A0A1F6F146_9BACT|nr:MAG: hypothetical protein A3A39_02470 [Candidatus Kaiserbacteria bacterium RIFCSPLOWO2_01_FULL_54_13]